MKLKLLILLCAIKVTDIWGLTAAFNLSKTTGCAPLVINFTDNSVPSGGAYITNWSYDFGDGGTSTTQNPKYTYVKGGTFKIKLTVTDNGNNTSTYTTTIYVLRNPTPDFSTAKSGYCPNEPILFTNKTTAGDTDIKAATWDFGDGNLIANKGDVTKTYALAGFYTVKLTVRDQNGCVGITTKSQFMTIDAGPKADFEFSSKYACTPPLKAEFTNKSSANSSTYLWDLGNGNTSTDPEPTDLYTTSGTYKITLTVSTKNGCKNTKTANMPVNFLPLKADFTLDKTTGCVPFDPQFRNNSTPKNINPDYAWDFGDGSKSTAENPTKFYSRTGTFTIKFRISGQGCSDSITKTVTVSDKPKVKLSMTDTVECDGDMNVTFKAASPDNIISRTWFIDGKNINTKVDSLNYQFGVPGGKKGWGVYKVYVSLQDFAGCETYVQYPDVVVQHIKSGFEYFAFGGCVPYTPPIVDTSIIRVPSKLKYKWDDGNGNIYSSPLPKISYAKEGVFDITLTISDTFGCFSEEIVPVKVGHKIKPSFIMDKTVICNNEKIIFWNTTPANQKSQAHSWKWEFQTAEGRNADSFSTKLRDYPARLTPRLIAENNECRDTTEKKDSVTLDPPRADFVINFDTCYNPTARITQKNIGATSFKWILPDGSSPTSGQLFIKITKKLEYKLIAYNSKNGCVDSVAQEIDVPTIKSAIHAVKDPESACTPQSFIIDNSKLKPSRTHWDFGDGDTSNIPDPYNWLNDMAGAPSDTFKHFYKAPGTYKIVHTAWDINGCIFTSEAKVTVVGPEVSGTVWPLKGCLPLKIHLQDSFSSDKPYKIKRKYWRIEDSDSLLPATNKDSIIEYTIQNLPLSGSPNIHVELVVEDVNGCTSTKTFIIRPSGPKAQIVVDKKLKCDVMEISLEMKIDSVATYLPVTTEWNMGDGNIITDNQFKYVYEKAGYYMARVRLRDGLGCTFTDAIEIGASQPEMLARFSLDNNTAPCPPLITQFKENSIIDNMGADIKYLWDFGDGTTSTEVNPGKIYTIPGNYDVSLTISNKFGCTNTKVLKNAIMLGGPKGTYLLEGTIGCEPVTVNFEIKNDSNTSVEWDFGDGNTLLASRAKHLYEFEGLYYPKIILKDSGGCTVVMIPKDSVLVFKRPVAGFTPDSYCFDDSILFHNFSSSEIANQPDLNYRWVIQGDTVKTPDFTYKFPSEGRFKTDLIVENAAGCFDTATQIVGIVKPRADFTSLKNKLCLGDSVMIVDKSVSDMGKYAATWFVNNIVTPIHGHIPGAGDHDITLIVTDTFGCTDTASLPYQVHVSDTIAATSTHLLNVSALSDHTFELKYKQSDDVNFRHYNLYNLVNGEWERIMNIGRPDSDHTIYTTGGVKQSQCFKITHTNYCDAESSLDSTDAHCSIHTTATGDINRNIVNWNPYAGWPVLTYKIYRQNLATPSVFDSIGIVKGDMTDYIDSTITCNTIHAYRIVAFGNDSIQISVSDSAMAKASWTNLLPSQNIVFVSVEKDTSVIVNWRLDRDYKRSNYRELLLYRWSSQGLKIQQLDLNANVFNDRWTGVDRYQYTYYTRVTDDCGDTSAPSYNSGNILLRSLSEGTYDPPEFRWNGYKTWTEGVRHYEVQRLNENNQFETIEVTTDSNYKDLSAINLCLKQFVYRVIATEHISIPGDTQSTSMSNHLRIKAKSSLFVPNAFTPNHNGLNEVFAPKGQYIYNYRMEIYNRWGERVFETTECMQGWDGLYKGEPAEEGIYYFKLNALGNDGQAYVYKGTLTLLK